MLCTRKKVASRKQSDSVVGESRKTFIWADDNSNVEQAAISITTSIPLRPVFPLRCANAQYTARQFAQWNVVFANLQQSKFSSVYISHIPLIAWNTSLVVCLHGCANACAMKQIFGQCEIILEGTLIATDIDFNRALAKCRGKAKMSAPVPLANVLWMIVFESCMSLFGYMYTTLALEFGNSTRPAEIHFGLRQWQIIKPAMTSASERCA